MKLHTNRDTLYDLYIVQDKSQQEIATMAGVTHAAVSAQLVKFGIKKDKTKINQLRERTNLMRYGAKYVTQLAEVQARTVQTSLAKYGCKRPTCAEHVKEKVKKTVQERHGVDYVLQLPEIRAKSHDSNRALAKQTSLERYGAPYYQQRHKTPEQIAAVETADSFRQFLINYATQYGHKPTTYDLCVALGYKPSTNGNTRISRRLTQFNLWEYVSQLAVVGKYRYDELLFDSSWELVFYLYHKQKGNTPIRLEGRQKKHCFEYTLDEKTRKWYPDFLLNDKYYEIKPYRCFARDPESVRQSEAKQKAHPDIIWVRDEEIKEMFKTVGDISQYKI